MGKRGAARQGSKGDFFARGQRLEANRTFTVCNVAPRPDSCQSSVAMKRREFLQTTLAASALAATSTVMNAAEAKTATREFYELRQYHLRQGPMLKRCDDFFREVGVPALNRAGVSPIGVFDLAVGPDAPTKYVLLPFKSLDAMAAAKEKVENDPDVVKSEFYNLPPTDPPYIRMESTLLYAFSGMPKLEVPTQVAAKKSRLFELRTYEAHSRKANQKKVEMFNVGEIEIFRRTGLTPVFFAEGVVGPKLPSLTYMLVFDDMPAHDKAWGTFGPDPEWKKLSTTPGYTNAEILTNITNVFLRPTGYSQI